MNKPKSKKKMIVSLFLLAFVCLAVYLSVADESQEEQQDNRQLSGGRYFTTTCHKTTCNQKISLHSQNYLNPITEVWEKINTTITPTPFTDQFYNTFKFGVTTGIYSTYFSDTRPKIAYQIIGSHQAKNLSFILNLTKDLVGVGYVEKNSYDYHILQTTNEVIPIIEGNKITYPNVFAGANVSYTYTSDKLKEDIILSHQTKTALENNPPSNFGLSNKDSWLVAVYTLALTGINMTNSSGNMIGNLTTDQKVSFLNALQDREEFFFPIGTAYSSSSTSRVIQKKFKLDKENKEIIMVIGVPVTWLNNETNAFPINYDPDIALSTNEEVYTYTDTPPLGEVAGQQIYMKFPISGLSSRAAISKAEIVMNLTAVTGAGARVAVYNCTGEWTEDSTFSTITELPCTDTGNSTNVAAFTQDLWYWDVKDTLIYHNTKGDSNFTLRFNSTNLSNVYLIQQDQETLRVGDLDGFGQEFVDFISSETSTTAQKPILNITYTINPMINFTTPTPVNGTTISDFIINVTITEEDASTIKFEWDDVNYTLFNDSLILMYNFDNVTSLGENGTLIKDISGNNNTGYGKGFEMDEWVAGKYGGHAVDFDGTDDYIAIDTLYYTGLGQIKHLTVCAWFKTTASGGAYNTNWAFVDYDRSEYYNFYIRGDTGVISFSTAGPTTSYKDFYGSTSVNDGDWHYGCGVFDSTIANEKALYLDGESEGVADQHNTDEGLGRLGTTRYGFIGDGSEALTFDGTRNNFYYDGIIDEVRIWNRSLSADEIAQHYYMNLKKYDVDEWGLLYDRDDLGTGTYTYRASIEDTDGQSNQTERRTITSDNFPPGITIVSPEAITYDTTSIDFNITIGEDASWCGFSLNDAESYDNHVAFYKFEGTAKDHISDYNGVVTGATITNDGKIQRAYKFDGINDYILIPNNNDMNIGIHNKYSISLWFNANNVSGEVKRVIFEQGGGSRGLNIYIWNNTVIVGGWNIPPGPTESGWTGTWLNTTINASTWYHVVLIINATSTVPYINPQAIYGYMDGVQFGVGQGSQLWSHSGDIEFGRVGDGTVFHDGPGAAGTSYYNGTIDEGNYYNTVLKPSQIRELAAGRWPIQMTAFTTDYWNFTNGSMTTGQHDIMFYCNDTSNRFDSSSLRMFAVDITPPVVILEWPQEAYVWDHNTTLQFNYTAVDTDGIDCCQIYVDWDGEWTSKMLDTSVTSGVQDNFTFIGMPNGTWKWSVNCNDTTGANGWSQQGNLTFGIDLEGPQLEIDYPQNTTYFYAVNQINYTYSDSNIEKCWYNTGKPGEENTTVVCNGRIIDLVSNLGTNTWWLYMNDTTGRVNTTNITFVRDIAPFDLTINSPTNNTHNNSHQDFNVTLSIPGEDAFGQYCRYSLDDWVTNITMTNHTSFSFGASNFSITDRQYTAKFWCNDTEGSENTNEKVTFLIDATFPLIDFNTPTYGNNDNVSQDSITINVSLTEINFQSMVFNLYSSGAWIDSYTTFDSTETLHTFTEVEDGIHDYNVTIYDTAGNTNFTSTRTITLDTTIPLIYYDLTLMSANNTNTTSNSIYTTVVIPVTGIANLTYNLVNSTSEVNRTNVGEDLIINFTTLDDGKYQYNVSTSDYAGNKNQTGTYLKNIDTTSPFVDYIGNTLANNTNSTNTSLLIDVSSIDFVTGTANLTFILVNYTSGSTTELNRTFIYAGMPNATLNFTSLEDGTYFYNVTATDYLGNKNTTEERTFYINSETAAPALSNFKFYALNSSKNVIGTDETAFNTSNLEDIEYMLINFTLTDATGIFGDIRLYYTANGTDACALGDNQSTKCYSHPNFIEYRNHTRTLTFNDVGGSAVGDYINCTYTGTSTQRDYTCEIDEHYNPNIWKNYPLNFSDMLWQDSVGIRIKKNVIWRINITNHTAPLDAEFYKLDFRVNASSNPTQPILAFLCNTSYSTGNPETTDECHLVASKLPSQLQDDGTKFRGIFTKNLTQTLGNKGFILITSDNVGTSYYAMKTYKYLGTESGIVTVSTNNGNTYTGSLANSYETETNLNWFTNNTYPTQLIVKIWSNDTLGNNANSSEQIMTWEFGGLNEPPLVDVVTPIINSNNTGDIDITWITAEPNGDTYTTNITISNGTGEESIATNLFQSISNFTWDSSTINDGNWNLTIKSCEDNTVAFFCGNDTHFIRLDNTKPLINFTAPTPNNNTNISWYTLTVNVTYTEINLANFTFVLSNQTAALNSTITTSPILTFTDLTNTTYTYNVTIIDSAGNKNFTETRTVIVNKTIAPGAEVNIIGELILNLDPLINPLKKGPAVELEWYCKTQPDRFCGTDTTCTIAELRFPNESLAIDNKDATLKYDGVFNYSASLTTTGDYMIKISCSNTTLATVKAMKVRIIEDLPSEMLKGLPYLAIILAIFSTAGLLIFFAVKQKDDHTPLKILFFVGSMLFLLIGLNLIRVVAGDSGASSSIMKLINTSYIIFIWVFLISVVLFIVYMVTQYLNEKREIEKMEEDE